jgi:hypothetical protein
MHRNQVIWFPELWGRRPSPFLLPPHHPAGRRITSYTQDADRRPPDVGARKYEISLKSDILPFNRVCQYSGGEKSLLNTEGTTRNLACRELYSGCPLCAALSLSICWRSPTYNITALGHLFPLRSLSPTGVVFCPPLQ